DQIAEAVRPSAVAAGEEDMPRRMDEDPGGDEAARAPREAGLPSHGDGEAREAEDEDRRDAEEAVPAEQTLERVREAPGQDDARERPRGPRRRGALRRARGC